MTLLTQLVTANPTLLATTNTPEPYHCMCSAISGGAPPSSPVPGSVRIRNSDHHQHGWSCTAACSLPSTGCISTTSPVPGSAHTPNSDHYQHSQIPTAACVLPLTGCTLPVLHFLVQHAPQTVRSRNPTGNLLLHALCSAKPSLDMFQFLLSSLDDQAVDAATHLKMTPLIVACLTDFS